MVRWVAIATVHGVKVIETHTLLYTISRHTTISYPDAKEAVRCMVR